jgi:GntR family transcriptional regulator
MVFEINFKSGMPVYLQMVDQVKAAVASGLLRPGDALPAIRPVAEEIRVNRNTVAKAYAELEAQGVIESRAGKGSVICEPRSRLRREARHELVEQEIDRAVVAAHHLNIGNEEFLRLVRERMDAFEARRETARSQPK